MSAPPSSPTQPETTSVHTLKHTHTDLGLIKRLLNPEEVCVRSFRGTILTSEYNLELRPPSLCFPSLITGPFFLPAHFLQGPSLVFLSLPFRSLGWVLCSGEVRAFSLTTLTDSKRLVCEASLEFICLNSFISPSVAPSLCPRFRLGGNVYYHKNILCLTLINRIVCMCVCCYCVKAPVYLSVPNQGWI